MKKYFFLWAILFFAVAMQAQRFTDSLFTGQLREYLKPFITSKQQEQTVATYIAFWQADLSDDHAVLVDLFNSFSKTHLPVKYILTYIDNSNRLLDSSKHDLLLQWSTQLLSEAKTSRTLGPITRNIEYVNSLLTTSRISPQKDLGIIIDGDYDFSLSKDGSFVFRTLAPVNLKIFLQRDTLIIHGTTGNYNTSTHVWNGMTGTIFWDRFQGINQKAFAKFGKYSLNTSKKAFEIPNVSFSMDYKTVKMTGLKGKLIMQFSYSPAAQLKNPKFMLYKDITYKGIVPKSVFKGKIIVEGKSFYLDGSMNFFLGKRQIISTQAQRYLITPKLLHASKVAFKLFLTPDETVYHPQVDMLILYDSASIQANYPYLANKVLSHDRPCILSFIRTSDSYGSQPFHDDFHQVNAYTAEMLWTFDSSVYFVNTRNRLEDTSYFESYSYYDPQEISRFYDAQGDNYAKLLYSYLRKSYFPDSIGLEDFTSYLLSLGIKTDDRRVFGYLDMMVQQGWLRMTYSSDLSNVMLYDFSKQFYHTIRASMRGYFVRDTAKLHEYTDDFDRIRIYSVAKADTVLFASSIGNFAIRGAGINAILNLSNNKLNIINPKPFYISPVRKVLVCTRKLTILKDFDLRFDGMIKAGLVRMKGKNFVYHSDSFNISLGTVKDMKLNFYRPVDSVYMNSIITDKGDTLDIYRYKYSLDSSISVLHNFSGILRIDYPDNKSGLLAKEDDGFPSLETTTESKIYYPKAKKVDTANFYFEDYPFRLDNLLFLTKDKISMTGTFHSSILADLDSITLTVQPDKSLGFRTVDTTKGFKIFGVATLVGSMSLDSKGLHSLSHLKFLSTYAWGNFDLSPDTLLGTTDTLVMYPVDRELKKKQHYPSEYPAIVYNYEADIKLQKNKDSTETMIVKQKDKQPLQIYPNFLRGEKRAYLDSARLEIGYDGVKASGIMDFVDAQIHSNNYIMNYDNFSSDTCRFVLKDSTFTQTLFNTSNVSCYMDLPTQIGTFVSNTMDNYVEFPRNRYIVYSDHFQWKINEGLIDIGGNLDDPRYMVVGSQQQRDSLIQVAGRNPKYIRLSGTRLVSMLKKNPVNFSASRTTFIPRQSILVAYDVPYLQIADAQIYSPQPIVIRIAGDIDTIRSARIIVGKWQHKIFDATVKVKDSLQYQAQGYYTYPPDQKIFFSPITVVDTTTYAYANMSSDTCLHLNDYFKFYGGPSNVDILLKGSDKYLKFNGYVKINNQCESMSPRLVTLDTVINPDSVMIPVTMPIKGKFARLYATPAVHKIDQSRYRMYNTFLTPAPDNMDRKLMTTQGYLAYSTHKAYYLIGSKEKIMNPDTALPMVAYDYKRCMLFADNQVDWKIDYGKVLDYKVWSRYRSILQDNRNNFYSTIVALNFPFPAKVLNDLSKDISNNDSVKFVFFDEDKNLYHTVLLAAQSDKEKQDFAQSAKLPPSLNGTLVLGDLDLIWDKNRVSYRTPKGKNRFAVLSVNGKELDAYVNGYVEFRYKRNGISRILIYIEVRPGVWYFFWYQFKGRNGTMRIATYNNKAERYISQMSKKQRTLAKHYTIGTAETDELLRFLSIYGKRL